MYIYKITNNLNNKIYVGQTINDVQVRFEEHCRPSKNKTLIDRAINKYGRENFTVETICETDSIDKLNELEIHYIAKLDSMNPEVGYNLCIGGGNTKGYRHRESSKRKMSESRMGIFAGEKNPFYGKHHTEETKKRLSEIHKGKPLSALHRKHLSETNPRKHKIICTTTGEHFNSLKEAADKYNLKSTHISRVCRGKRKSCGGYKFIYDNTVLSPND